MIDFQKMALKIIEKNPNLAKDPQNKELIDALRSGDQKKGEELALRLCTDRGVTPEQAVSEAKNFFKLS